MLKKSLAYLLLVSGAAFASRSKETTAIDAFLSRHESRPLVDSPSLRRGYASSIEPRYGVPTFFWAFERTNERSLRDAGLTAEEAARRHLVAHAELYRADAARWAQATVSQVHDLHDGSAVIVSFQQRFNGVRVFRDEIKVIMTAQFELVALAGYLTPQIKMRGEFVLSAQSALGRAHQHLTGKALADGALTAQDVPGSDYQHWPAYEEGRPWRTRAVYFPLPDGVVPAFYIELEVPQGTRDWVSFSYVVSAADGTVLYRKDLTASDAFTYQVWADAAAPYIPFDGPHGVSSTPHPTGTPNHFNPGTVPQNQVTLSHAGLSTLDPWLAPGATQTSGNNVRAYADLARNNGFTSGSDLIGTASAPGEFRYTYDFGLGPQANANQQQAAVIQLFYNSNFFHDWYYDDGFNEAAGNSQGNNLGRGGLGNDAMLVEAQDYAGRNNANMSTPSDGASPRMQMFIFDGSGGTSLTANTGTPQTFDTGSAAFGPQTFNLTAPLALANDGDATPTDGCAASWAGPSVNGRIVLVDRGSCTFADKARNAQAAGASGIVIANNQAGGAMSLSGTTTATIPVLAVSQADGNTLKSIISAGSGATTVTMSRASVLDRDGTLDNGVVAHEWGHFISNRLIGDGNGISNTQAVGMGEGWGDFHAALMLARAEDANVPANANWTGAFALSGWSGSASSADGYYFGFRRYPISVDFSKNPLTFKHISDGVRLPTTVPIAFGASGQDNAEVHNTGEVWAVMLWECYVSLLKDSRFTFNQAQARMKRYLVASYKATPVMPTFIDARDAVLAVAAANDATDFASFWAAFARRGLGMGAEAPDRDSQDNTPVVESFTVGNALMITEVKLDDATDSCDHDGVLDAHESGELTITLKNTGTNTLSGTQVTVSSEFPGLTFPQGASVAMPSTPPFGVATVTLTVALDAVVGPQGANFKVTATDPALTKGPVVHDAMFRVNFDMVPMSSQIDDAESPQSTWVASSDPDGNTGSDFRLFQSSATEHLWFGPNPASPADTYLTSPELNVGNEPLTVSFKHRFDFEDDGTESYDGAVIEVSVEGGAFVDVGAKSTPGYTGTLTTSQNQSSNPLRGRPAFVAKSTGYPAFVDEKVALGTEYAGKKIRFRFRIGADDAAAAKGWEIDDIQFTGITNKPFSSVVTDPNGCTNTAPVASVPATQEVLMGQSATVAGSGTDAENDPLTYAWAQVSGPLVTLTGNRTQSVSFEAPFVSTEEVVRLSLVVSDGRLSSAPAFVDVIVKHPATGAMADTTVKPCGCTSGTGLLPLAAVGLLIRRVRRRKVSRATAA